MVGLDVHDVVVFGDRPIGSEHAVPAVMHRLLRAQPVEIRPERIGAKQLGIAGIELRQRERPGALSRRLLMGIGCWIAGSVHRTSPDRTRPWLGPAGDDRTKLHSVAGTGARASLCLFSACSARDMLVSEA